MLSFPFRKADRIAATDIAVAALDRSDAEARLVNSAFLSHHKHCESYRANTVLLRWVEFQGDRDTEITDRLEFFVRRPRTDLSHALLVLAIQFNASVHRP